MDILDQIVDALKKRNLIRSGQVEYAKKINRVEPQGQEIDLGVLRTPELGNGIKVGAHQSFRTFGGTDETVNITVVYDENVSGKKQDKIFDNDSYECSPDEMFSGATIYNTLQTGKVLSYRAYRDMKFKNGSTKFRGTVSVNLPTVGGNQAKDTTAGTVLTPATATNLASDLNIKKRTIQNKTIGSAWVGWDATVSNTGATRGLEIEAGETWETENKANLYIYPEVTQALGALVIVKET